MASLEPPDETPAARSGREWLHSGLRLAAGGLLVWLVVRQVDVAMVGRLLAGCDLRLFALACLLLAAGVAANALRWQFVLRSLGGSGGISTAMVGNFEAMFFNQLLPTGAGGDAARVVRAVDSGLRPGWSIIAVLIDRAFGLWFVALCIAAPAFLGGTAVATTSTFSVLALVSAVVLVGGLGSALVAPLVQADRFPSWAGYLVTLLQAYGRVVRERRFCLAVGGALIASTAATVASFAVTSRALGVGLGWIDATVILQGMVLASLIPVSLGGWGLREGAAMLLFAGIGVDANRATAVAVLFGLVLSVLGIVGACVWLASGYDRVSLDRLRGLGRGDGGDVREDRAEREGKEAS